MFEETQVDAIGRKPTFEPIDATGPSPEDLSRGNYVYPSHTLIRSSDEIFDDTIDVQRELNDFRSKLLDEVFQA